MKLITRDTDYALRALSFIAGRKKQIVTVAELVEELKIPRPFLRKILQVLNKRDILKSHKGKGGGFLLASEPDKLFLTDLMEVFQGPLRLNECSFKRLPCPNMGSCVLRRKISAIERYVVSQLRTITLASLL